MRGEVKEVRDEVYGFVHEKMAAVEANIAQLQQRIQRTSVGSVSNTLASNIHRIKLPNYDGQSPWTTYKRQFDAAAEVNGWTDEEKATALVLALRGPALELLQTVPESDQKNFGTLVKVMELRYGDNHVQQIHQTRLKTRVQKN